MSVRPSVRLSAWKTSGSYRTDFHEISYFITFRKAVEKIQFSLQSDNNNGYFTRTPTHISDHISLSSS
jgi:hypothetical protein